MEKNYVTLLNKKSPTHKSTKTAIVPILASLLFTLASASSFAADDEYLRALQMEARDAESTPKKLAVNDGYLDALSAEAEASAKVGKGRNKTVDEDRVEMETLLQHEKPTSYKYYKKLKAHDKKKIAEAYRADTAEDTETRLDNLRHKILDLYFKR